MAIKYPQSHYVRHSSFWRPTSWSLYKTLRRHNEENVSRHPERMWRICHRGGENRKVLSE